MKVLIAEDDPVTRQVLQNHLEKWGHEVVAAENGVEAWKLFQSNDIHIVISDWMMPEMNGLDLVFRIRSFQGPIYVYIIILTAKTRKEDIVRGMEAGADDVLAKPFDREELRVRLRAAERIVRLEQDLAGRNAELQKANAQIGAANLRMKRDLEAAAKIQQALLPTTLPTLKGARFAWAFNPCEELAGDNLGIVKLDDSHVALYVLDVSGHGLAAALLSVSVRHLLSPLPASTSLLRQPIPGQSAYQLIPPVQVADQLNRRFPMDFAIGQFFTLLYGILNLETRQFRYVSAGQPGPVHLRGDEDGAILASPGYPIGILREPAYEENVLALARGDRLYLYSDGIVEAGNAKNEQFGNKRLLHTLRQSRRFPLKESLDHLISNVEEWCATPHLRDDVSLVAAEMTDD
ncbi:MAG TPA: SpoIIE family protein phosphatase [Gemmataceae bacterium]|jgi:sigma-B regulation protein RsbU (phosphoserine phosphatase)|nr:SpoIIE family protein phosphatase [Gemmataceae bacterium]